MSAGIIKLDKINSANNPPCGYNRIKMIVIQKKQQNLEKIMKIVIFNEELRSEMQMYLALSNRHDVEIAQDLKDLMLLLEEEADLTFLDFDSATDKKPDILDVAKQVLKKNPKIKVVGICNQKDSTLQKRAADHGIVRIITRPIKNRELLKAIQD